MFGHRGFGLKGTGVIGLGEVQGPGLQMPFLYFTPAPQVTWVTKDASLSAGDRLFSVATGNRNPGLAWYSENALPLRYGGVHEAGVRKVL